jgi:hypothetical protein
MFTKTQRRAGSTMVELVIYMALLGIVITSVMPLLFMSAEDRLLQQTISVVEENGTQVLQNLTFRIRNGERIISPIMGQSGSVLVVQTASGATNPTVIGYNSGAIVIVEGTHQQTITSSQIGVLDFRVRNTSTSATRQSVEIAFHITRTTRLLQPHYYLQYFNTSIALFPDDQTQSNTTTCSAPNCNPRNLYNWQVYNTSLEQCLDVAVPMYCP